MTIPTPTLSWEEPDNDLLTDVAANLLTDEHRGLFRDLLQGALQTLIEE